MAKTAFQKTLTGLSDFEALGAAEDFIRSIGASYGSSQRGAATGIMFGDVYISKWRGLNARERDELHGVIDAGDHRHGPVIVRIFDSAPADKLAALSVEAA